MNNVISEPYVVIPREGAPGFILGSVRYERSPGVGFRCAPAAPCSSRGTALDPSPSGRPLRPSRVSRG
jgi:hypothetical protein